MVRYLFSFIVLFFLALNPALLDAAGAAKNPAPPIAVPTDVLVRVQPAPAELAKPPAAAPVATTTAARPPAQGTPSASSALVSAQRPVALSIPAINVETSVEAVGKTRSGAMDVPSDVDEVAWYQPGAAPGETGNAVMAGHLDRIGGAPAVFWRLNQLEAGDRIFVTDSEGATFEYRVTGAEIYPYNRSPIHRIFGFSLGSHLNLITCRGSWNTGAGTYTERLVVYSELVGEVQKSSTD